MKVYLKIFPISGTCPETKDIYLELTDGATVAELLEKAEAELHAPIPTDGKVMMLHIGVAVDIAGDPGRELGKDDWLWLMPAVGKAD